jgi:hypothetical protein
MQRFLEPRFEPFFMEKKDLSLHFTVEIEILSFENGDVPMSCQRFWGSAFESTPIRNSLSSTVNLR